MSSKRVLIVDGAPRSRGNTKWITDFVVGSLKKRKIEPTIISTTFLKSRNNGCIGCQGCQKSREYLCVFKDDVHPVLASMPSYQYIIFTSPVYFFSPTAQLKLVLDRMYSLFKLDKDGKYIHPFEKNTKFALIATAGGKEGEGCDLLVEIFKRTADILGFPLEVLTLCETPMSPEEFSENECEQWESKAQEFCLRLLGS